MSKEQHNIGPTAVPPKEPAFREVLEQISNTKEVRQLAGDLVPELIRLWAISGTGAGPARSMFRKSVANAAGSSIKNAMLDEKGLREAPPLHSLVSDPEFTRRASAQTGLMLNELLATLVKGAEEIEGLDVAAKKALAENLVHDVLSGKSAEILTLFCRTLNDIHKEDPDYLSRILAPAFENWIQKLDFGELKEALESGLPGMSALVRMINETMWNYPGKVISIVALLPSITNMTIDALGQTIGTFNNKGTPDMVADVLLTVLREIDADAVGRLLNETAEQTRQLHVGSALIGEPGAPQLPNDLATLFHTIFETINGEVLWKARNALAEIKSQALCALTNVMTDHPELLTGSLATKSGVHNARIRAMSHRLSALEAFDPEATNNALGEALANLDVQEGANIINAAAMLALGLLDSRPDEINDKASSMVDALDIYSLSELAEKTGAIVGGALRPLARSIFPHLARGMIGALRADDDEFEDAAEETRNLLAALLNDGGGS